MRDPDEDREAGEAVTEKSAERLLGELTSEVLQRKGQIIIGQSREKGMISIDVTWEGRKFWADATDLRQALILVQQDIEAER